MCGWTSSGNDRLRSSIGKDLVELAVTNRGRLRSFDARGMRVFAWRPRRAGGLKEQNRGLESAEYTLGGRESRKEIGADKTILKLGLMGSVGNSGPHSDFNFNHK